MAALRPRRVLRPLATILGRLGVEVTAGALSQAAQATGTALVPVHNALVKAANDADVVVMDETGWRVGGNSAWLWVATNEHVTVYDVAAGRGFDQACDLIGEDYTGTIVRDGWAPYRRYEHARHQTCLAHLLRRCHHLVDDLPDWAGGTPRVVGDILHEALDARDLDDTRRAEVAADLAERIDLLTAQAQPHDECRKLVAHLANEADALFSFLTAPGVDATNWRAEQAIRPAVVNHKTWGGNRTWRGAATRGRVTSVLRTATSNDPDLDLLLIRFHLESGARRQGATEVRLRDLDHRRATVWLREKLGPEREQPVSPSLLRSLARHAAHRGAVAPDDPVLRTRRGRPIGRRHCNTLFDRARLGIPPLGGHLD